jgi:hypothetical protein
MSTGNTAAQVTGVRVLTDAYTRCRVALEISLDASQHVHGVPKSEVKLAHVRAAADADLRVLAFLTPAVSSSTLPPSTGAQTDATESGDYLLLRLMQHTDALAAMLTAPSNVRLPDGTHMASSALLTDTVLNAVAHPNHDVAAAALLLCDAIADQAAEDGGTDGSASGGSALARYAAALVARGAVSEASDALERALDDVSFQRVIMRREEAPDETEASADYDDDATVDTVKAALPFIGGALSTFPAERSVVTRCAALFAKALTTIADATRAQRQQCAEESAVVLSDATRELIESVADNASQILVDFPAAELGFTELYDAAASCTRACAALLVYAEAQDPTVGRGDTPISELSWVEACTSLTALAGDVIAQRTPLSKVDVGLDALRDAVLAIRSPSASGSRKVLLWRVLGLTLRVALSAEARVSLARCLVEDAGLLAAIGPVMQQLMAPHETLKRPRDAENGNGHDHDEDEPDSVTNEKDRQLDLRLAVLRVITLLIDDAIQRDEPAIARRVATKLETHGGESGKLARFLRSCAKHAQEACRSHVSDETQIASAAVASTVAELTTRVYHRA